MSHNSIDDSVIRDVVENALGDRLTVDVDSLDLDQDLFSIGMDSLNVIRLVLAVEEAFELEIPDSEIRMENLSSLSSLSELIGRLK